MPRSTTRSVSRWVRARPPPRAQDDLEHGERLRDEVGGAELERLQPREVGRVRPTSSSPARSRARRGGPSPGARAGRRRPACRARSARRRARATGTRRSPPCRWSRSRPRIPRCRARSTAARAAGSADRRRRSGDRPPAACARVCSSRRATASRNASSPGRIGSRNITPMPGNRPSVRASTSRQRVRDLAGRDVALAVRRDHDLDDGAGRQRRRQPDEHAERRRCPARPRALLAAGDQLDRQVHRPRDRCVAARSHGYRVSAGRSTVRHPARMACGSSSPTSTSSSAGARSCAERARRCGRASWS